MWPEQRLRLAARCDSDHATFNNKVEPVWAIVIGHRQGFAFDLDVAPLNVLTCDFCRFGLAQADEVLRKKAGLVVVASLPH